MTKFFEDYGVLIQIGGPIAIFIGMVVWALIEPLSKRVR